MCSVTGLWVYAFAGAAILLSTAYDLKAMLYLSGAVLLGWNAFKLYQVYFPTSAMRRFDSNYQRSHSSYKPDCGC